MATVGGIGLVPVAPGTFGAAAGIAAYLGLAVLGPALYALTTVGLAALGVWAADGAGRRFGREDDGRIVIDEVAGQLLALLPLVVARSRSWVEPLGSVEIVGLVTGFVAFRVFDIAKPGPVRRAERGLEGTGGLGVMADDLVAGGLAAGVVALAVAIALPVLGGSS